MTSIYDPRAPTLAAVEEERKILCNEEELHDKRDDTKKNEEHIYPVRSPAQFNQAVTPISSPMTLSSLFYLLSRLPRKYPLIQLRLTRHLPHLYDLITIPQMYSQILLLLPELDYRSQFSFLKTISLKLQEHFLHLGHYCLTFDLFFLAPITSNSSLIISFLDVSVALNFILITHAEPDDPGLISTYNTVSNQSSANLKYSFGKANVKNT